MNQQNSEKQNLKHKLTCHTYVRDLRRMLAVLVCFVLLYSQVLEADKNAYPKRLLEFKAREFIQLILEDIGKIKRRVKLGTIPLKPPKL